MSAHTAMVGLLAAFSTIDGLTNVLLGEPTTIQETPALYLALNTVEVTLRNMAPARNLGGTTYRFTARLVVQWVDNAQAEQQLIAFADAIPDAIAADPRLGGRLPSGIAQALSGAAGYLTISGTVYRVLDFDLSVLEKESA